MVDSSLSVLGSTPTTASTPGFSLLSPPSLVQSNQDMARTIVHSTRVGGKSVAGKTIPRKRPRVIAARKSGGKENQKSVSGRLSTKL